MFINEFSFAKGNAVKEAVGTHPTAKLSRRSLKLPDTFHCRCALTDFLVSLDLWGSMNVTNIFKLQPTFWYHPRTKPQC